MSGFAAASSSRLPPLAGLALRPSTLIKYSRCQVSAYSSTPRRHSPHAKVETIPFQATPEVARQRLATAAASAFGMSTVAALLWTRFVGGEEPIDCVAFKAMLLPYWKIDLSLRGIADVNDVEMDLTVTTLDATLPGFTLDPLHHLSLTSLSEAAPVPYDPSVHLRQLDTDVYAVPFSLSPLNLLEKIKNLPRNKTVFDDFSLNPASFKSNMFAAYPLYLPVYLAEFVDRSEEQRRVTCVALATLASPGFAIYPSFLDSPRWLPNGDGIEISIAGVPVDRTAKISSPGALQKLKPQLDDLIGQGRAVEFCDPVGDLKEIEGNSRMMGYVENAQVNKVFIAAALAVTAAESNLKFAQSMPDEGKTVVLSKKGLKVQGVKDMKASLLKSVEKVKKDAEKSKPSWLIELEKQTAARR